MAEQEPTVTGMLAMHPEGGLLLHTPDGQTVQLEPSPQVSARLLLRFLGETITLRGQPRSTGAFLVEEVRWSGP